MIRIFCFIPATVPRILSTTVSGFFTPLKTYVRISRGVITLFLTITLSVQEITVYPFTAAGLNTINFSVQEIQKESLQNPGNFAASWFLTRQQQKELSSITNSAHKKVDSGGRLLNNIGYNIERGSESKLKWMRNYKFSITFENASYPGYTTEKLMHALISDTIPIYWGDPLVANDFNPKAFVNCLDFHSYSEVVELIREIDHNDNLYREYLSQPYLKDNKETDFCREENIVGRYDEILSSKRYFVSPIRKKIQRPLYELSVLNKLAAKAFRTIKGYGNQAILVLRQKIQGLRK